MLSSSPGRRSFTSASPVIPEVPQAEPDPFDIREHTFVKTTFSKPVGCRVCLDPVKKGAVLCSHCSLIAHAKCAGRAPPTCDLRSKLLMQAQFAGRGSPTDIFTRLPPPAAPASDGLGASSSSRGSLDRERANSPQPSAPSPAHPPVSYKVLSPFKRSHASHTPDPMNSNSSISLAPPVSQKQQQQQPVKSLLPEGNVIRRKLSIILTRQRELNAYRDRPRPQSISSISSSSPHSPQTNSIRSLHTAAESISSRAARLDASISGATESSTGANAGMLRASIYSSVSTVPDDLRESSITADASSSAPPSTSISASAPTSKAPVVVTAQDTHRTRRGRGQSKSSNCAIQ
ncbi:hypothetical protein BC827DRAFT_605166 [Russula dissimulans]|nr:hypothetical protein BC827DRAFT_605166 [Russula dissimulans]